MVSQSDLWDEFMELFIEKVAYWGFDCPYFLKIGLSKGCYWVLLLDTLRVMFAIENAIGKQWNGEVKSLRNDPIYVDLCNQM
jgi:hypothetical protein